MPPADDDLPPRRPNRANRPEDEFEDDDRPRRRRRDEDDDEDDRPRRRRRPQGDATGGLIPYKNSQALIAYYLSVFALIPCVAFLAPVAVVLGVLGLQHANKHPEASGKAHALVGICLGTAIMLGYVAAAVYFGVVVAGK